MHYIEKMVNSQIAGIKHTGDFVGTASQEAKSPRQRIRSLDLLRGLAIILMALDHVRTAFSGAGNPMNLEQTSVALFLTRWLTHFCAPAFILLAGTGVFLSLFRGRDKSGLARFLLSRGLWLIFLDLFALNSSLDLHHIGLGVLWAIGWSMIILVPLLWLPYWAMMCVALVQILGHNLLDHVDLAGSGLWGWLWTMLHTGGNVEWMSGFTLQLQYPIVPWVGIMTLGYCLGTVFTWDGADRKRFLMRLGFCLCFGFVVLRGINMYGDPVPWSLGSKLSTTAMEFLNCEKYPPSLLFLMMTLGPTLWLVGVAEKQSGGESNIVNVFGRVPLFFYVLHLPIIKGSAKLAKMSFLAPGVKGFSLPMVYLVWICLVLALFPICRWYDRIKTFHRWPILRYL